MVSSCNSLTHRKIQKERKYRLFTMYLITDKGKMAFEIFIHREADKILESLDVRTQERIRSKLNYLKENPYHKRSGADIKRIIDTNPVLYRLRVGDYRFRKTVNISTKDVYASPVLFGSFQTEYSRLVEVVCSRTCRYFLDSSEGCLSAAAYQIKLESTLNPSRILPYLLQWSCPPLW